MIFKKFMHVIAVACGPVVRNKSLAVVAHEEAFALPLLFTHVMYGGGDGS